MHRFIVAIITMFFTLPFYAQSEEHLSFMGIPIDGSNDIFVERLKTEKGFVETNKFKSAYFLTGKFANEIVDIMVLASSRTNTVCKVIVYFPKKDSWSALREDYFSKKKLYRSKYNLDSSYEFFSSPYEEGDGYEMTAVKIEKCKYISFFREDCGGIIVSIKKTQQVEVSYEDTTNMRIAQTELKTDAYNDI